MKSKSYHQELERKRINSNEEEDGEECDEEGMEAAAEGELLHRPIIAEP